MSPGNIEGFSNGAPDSKIADSRIDIYTIFCRKKEFK